MRTHDEKHNLNILINNVIQLKILQMFWIITCVDGEHASMTHSLQISKKIRQFSSLFFMYIIGSFKCIAQNDVLLGHKMTKI